MQINRAEWSPHTLLGLSHTWALHVCVGEPLVLLNGRHLPSPPVLPRALTSLSHRASSYALTALCIIRKCRSAERYQNWSQIVCSLPIRCYSFKFKFENNQKWQLEPKHEGWEAFFDGNPNDIVCWRLEHFVGKERTGLWLKKELFSKIISGRGEAVKFRPLRSEWGDTELAFVANIWHACN